jgi:hypothetical protein
MKSTYLGLRSFDDGGGVWPAIEAVADKLGVDRRTVMRNLRKLAAVGAIEVTECFQGRRQKTNFYLFPTPEWWLEEGGQKGCKSPLEGCHSDFPKGQVRRGGIDTSISPGSKDGDRDGGGEESEVVSSSDVSTSEPSSGSSHLPGEIAPRPPWKLLPRNCLFYTHPDTRELVDHFADLIGARDIAEKGKTRKVSVDRLRRWEQSANTLLDQHPVAELQAIVSWVFGHCLGYLPFGVVNEYTGRFDDRERKVTRLAQIGDHYPRLLAMMNQRPEVVPDPDDRGEGAVVEDQIAVLVELFAKTRRRGPSDFDLFGWRKTFRIMLTHRQIPYQDIVMVVEALGDKRLRLDFDRYHAPYDLVGRPGEWENILAWVKIALLREQMMPTPAPSRRLPFDDDDIGHIRCCADDTVGSVDMSKNTAQRHRRYLARAVNA